MRKLNTIFSVSILIVLISLAPAFADSGHEMKPYVGSTALESIKTLSGEWKRTAKEQDGKANEVLASYEVTSNGSAVVEKIFKGTPMEMTSIYFERDGKLMMTHFCSLANQPTLGLTDQNGDTLTFDFVSGLNMDPAKDMHIHGLKLEIGKDGSLVQTWTGMTDGKDRHQTVLNLKRGS